MPTDGRSNRRHRRDLEKTQQRVTLEAYADWDRYDTNLQGHIAQVYTTLKGTR